VALDIELRRRLVSLLDTYAELLTEHQRETLRLHLERDWSYSEIADAQGVSRTAVYDLVQRAGAVLRAYESKLGLMAAEEERRRVQDTLTDRLDELEDELSKLRETVKGLT
jgi:predicted DNA-binding protein YlxM (UPF0122 family)